MKMGQAAVFFGTLAEDLVSGTSSALMAKASAEGTHQESAQAGSGMEADRLIPPHNEASSQKN